jgi:putative sterol carrier protein
MTTAAEKMELAKAAILKNASAASQVGATYKFVLDGTGGGTWIVALKDSPAITEGDGDAECVIKMSASDYVDMVEGKTEAQQLFFAGKLQIDGDMALAMKLQALNELMSQA